MQLLTVGVIAILCITAWILRKRFKKQAVYMLLFIFIITLVHFVMSSDDKYEKTQEDDSLNDVMALRGRFEFLMRTAVFFCMYGCPSMPFACLYITIYIGAIVWLTSLEKDPNRP